MIQQTNGRLRLQNTDRLPDRGARFLFGAPKLQRKSLGQFAKQLGIYGRFVDSILTNRLADFLRDHPRESGFEVQL